MTRTATPLSTLAALGLAGAVATLVACAGAPMSRKAGATSSDAAAAPLLGGRPDELRDRIRALDAAIDRDLGAAALERPDAAAVAAVASTPMADVRATCAHVPSTRCEDVCALSGSICDNAASICDLAAELPGDAWAAERCDAAKAACQRATGRCCAGACAAPP